MYGALASLGLAATGPVVANAVVSRWFHRKRGTAVSLLGSASMTGMSLLVPVMAWMILTVGWRMTYVAIGLFVLVCMVPMCLFVVRDSPESMGLGPDGDPIPEGIPRRLSSSGRPSAKPCARWPSGSSPARS